jgi:hypothetical protein
MSLADDLAKERNVKASANDSVDGMAWAQVGLDGGELSTGAMPTELVGDWDAVLRSFGLDPTVFEVADDTVRMSKWQSSKRLENGDRDLIWLWSYRAKFKRKSLTALNDAEIDDIRKYVHKWKPPSTKVTVSNETPCTFVFNWADLQLGKSAGGGVAATVDRMVASIDAGVKRIKELQRAGHNIEGIAFTNMGDPFEGCDGNYASQLFTVELTQRQQLLLGIDLFAKAITTLAPLTPRLDVVGVLCNHGEWMRRGGKQVTSDSDNSGGFLLDALYRILDGHVPNLEWTIPHDEMVTTKVLSDVKVAFAHGHKISGKKVDWFNAQSIKVLREEGREPDLWVTAHYHHLEIIDHGAYTSLQCPSLDGGSKWFADSKGIWSTAGVLTFLVGRHDIRNYSDLAVL